MNETYYKITLTADEHKALAFITNRGYFPAETFDAMVCVGEEGNPETGESTATYEIPEHAAWAVLEHREVDPRSLFACASPALLEKLLKLESEIV